MEPITFTAKDQARLATLSYKLFEGNRFKEFTAEERDTPEFKEYDKLIKAKQAYLKYRNKSGHEYEFIECGQKEATHCTHGWTSLATGNTVFGHMSPISELERVKEAIIEYNNHSESDTMRLVLFKRLKK